MRISTIWEVFQICSHDLKREGEEKEELSETFAVLDKDQDTFISREGQKYSARYY